MAAGDPLPTLLSQVLVAFTIEFDDLFEQRMPHSTTTQDGAGLHGEGPWLVSQVMWTNHLCFVGDGIEVGELQALGRVSLPALKSRLNHLSWWNYVAFAPAAQKAPFRRHVVRLTDDGRRAAEIWSPLAVEVESRWTSRFGKRAIAETKAALRSLIADPHLPHYMPVVEYGNGLRTDIEPADGAREGLRSDISALVAQALLGLTLDIESEAEVALPIAANLLRILDAPVAIREVPLLAGVSKEAASAGLKFLEKHGYTSGAPDHSGVRTKSIGLTEKGQAAWRSHEEHVRNAEKRLRNRVGPAAVDRAYDMLDRLLTRKDKVATGLQPHEGSWRLEKPYVERTEAYLGDPRATLPRHPMVLHRGGFPDGS